MRKKVMGSILGILVMLLFLSVSMLAADIITLEEAIQLGLKNNSSLKESQLENYKAEINLDSARRAFYPEINLSTSYTRLFIEDDGSDMGQIPPGLEILFPIIEKMQPAEDNYQTAITVQQPLYLGGKLRLGLKQAEKGLEIARIQHRQRKNELIYNIIQSYYNVLLAEKRVEIEQEALRLIQEHKRVAQVSYQTGISLKTDLLQAEIEESKAVHSLQTARNDLKMIKKMFGNLIGAELNDKELSPPDFSPLLDLDLEAQYQAAKAKRAELKLLDANQSILEINRELQQKSHLPNLFLVGNYQWQGEEFSLDTGTGSITLSLSMNIFDKGIAKNEMLKLEEDLKKLALNKSNLEDMIRLEIEDLLLNIEEQKNNIKIQKMNLQKAEENLELETKRYQAGTGTNLEVLNAQMILKQTRIAAVQAEYQYQLSLFQLLEKTGSLIDYYEEAINNEK